MSEQYRNKSKYAPLIEKWKRRVARFKSNTLTLVGGFVVVLLTVLALGAPWIVPYPGAATGNIALDQIHKSPSTTHLFGTDAAGRDVFSRTIFGIRTSLRIGVSVLGIAIGIGVPLGLIAGYVTGLPRAVIMRAADSFISIPPLVLALAVTTTLGANLTNAIIGIAVVWWPWYTRLVSAEVQRVKQEEFVEANRVLGASDFRIIVREILPNVTTPILVKGTLDMGFAILIGAALSFLGLGAQPPTPDLGTMMANSRQYLPEVWWGITLPGVALFLTVLGFNVLGDGFRDLFDVEMEEGR